MRQSFFGSCLNRLWLVSATIQAFREMCCSQDSREQDFSIMSCWPGLCVTVHITLFEFSAVGAAVESRNYLFCTVGRDYGRQFTSCFLNFRLSRWQYKFCFLNSRLSGRQYTSCFLHSRLFGRQSRTGIIYFVLLVVIMGDSTYLAFCILDCRGDMKRQYRSKKEFHILSFPNMIFLNRQ